MTSQFGRVLSLKVGDDAGSGYDLSGLRVTFEVRNATVQTPKSAQIRVFNLAQEKASTIVNEFTQVVLAAGYQEVGPSTIFNGTIVMTKRGRNGPDTYIEIFAQDGDGAYNYATISKSLAAGWTWDQVYDELLTVLQPYGITAGYKPDFGTQKGLRGVTLDGDVKSQLSILAKNNSCDWFFEDDQLIFVPVDGVIKTLSVVSLTTSSGLLGVPDQTTDGIIATCLLRPEIRAGQMIQIDNASIAETKVRQSSSSSAALLPFIPDKSSDGSYRAVCVTHIGDTRGDDWYTDLVCVNLASPTVGGASITAVPDA